MADSELNDRGHFIDSFGNTEFHILIDGDGDNAINVNAIERLEVRNQIDNSKTKIRGAVHMYVYPSDRSMINKQLITTWSN